MVTDLASVDLILQRMGRMHRSAALLSGRDVVTLPDIAPLVQAGYAAIRLGPDGWQDAMRTAQGADERRARDRRANADKYLLCEVGDPKARLDGWYAPASEMPTTIRARVGQVRDGAESLEVLVVQRDWESGLLTLDWIDRGAGRQIPLDQEVPRDLARAIAACALRLPLAMNQMNPVGDGVVTALERNRYKSFDQTPLLAGQLVLVLDANRSAELRHGPAAFSVT